MKLLEKGILTGYLLWGSWYDIRKKAVPLQFLFLGGILAVLDIVCRGWDSGRMSAMLPGMGLLLLSRVTGGIGEADGIVLALVGFMSRDKNILLVLGASLLFIFFYSMILFCKKRNHSLQIPYLPFLLAAYITTWMIE